MYEVLLGDEYLMSSAFTVAEQQLAHLALDRLGDGLLDLVIGGLGLGYTAAAALADRRVRMLAVVDAFDAVIGWHRRCLLPTSPLLLEDPRCTLVAGDFFAGLHDAAAWKLTSDQRVHAVWSTSTTARGICCIPPMPSCTRVRDLLRWPAACMPAGCMRCGPMTRQTTRFSVSLAPSSPTWRHTR